MINRGKVLKISEICELIFVAFFVFLTGYLLSFFYYLEKDVFWEIRIGFPFPHFGYNFMGSDCQNFLWGYGSGAGKIGKLALLNPLLPVIVCYVFYLIFKKQNIELQQKIRKLFFIVILPILIFCSISFISFFPLEKQKRVNDILIGFPFKFYEYKYIGENCLTIIKSWNILFLVIDFALIYIIYSMAYLFFRNIETKNSIQ